MTRKKRNLEDSPLLNLNSDMQSQIKPEKLDISRFSRAESTADSPLKIIFYVLVVILLGVGGAFGVRYFLNKNETSNTQTAESNENTTTSVFVSVNSTAILDEQASNPSGLSDYSNVNLMSIGDASVDPKAFEVNKMTYQKFTTFSRLTLDFASQTVSTNIPTTTIKLDTDAKNIKVELKEGVSVVAELSNKIQVGEIIDTFQYDASSRNFILTLKENSVYSAKLVNQKLIFDIKSLNRYNQESNVTAQETKPVEETETSTTNTSNETLPETSNVTKSYTNEYSRNSQKIVSSNTANTIEYTTLYYEDFGPEFELAWGSKKNSGDAYVPNATASMITIDNQPVIELKISNLSSVPTVGNYNASNIGVNIQYANFNSSNLVSFTNGVATYRIFLKYVADYKLESYKNSEGITVLSLKLKD